ncbi:MAG: helix-turn-helix domain-containing protein [Alphaproteobacteria bacterium]|nr:helix-turn-helix domain-containing protein [Alphaproteobacteria bacterium]
MTSASANKIKHPNLRSENPDPVDVHVGGRMRVRRNLVGLSQEQLGKALGLTFQQIQKYERGVNRMGSSRLFHISQILSVPVSYFFEEMPGVTQPGFAEEGQEQLEGAPSNQNGSDILHRRETLELVRAYYRIQDAKQRRKVYELIKSMADEA